MLVERSQRIHYFEHPIRGMMIITIISCVCVHLLCVVCYSNEILHSILKAYSLFDDELGYSQGMAFLAAMLMLHIEDEEMVFWCLVRIMFSPEFNVRALYSEDCLALIRWYIS